MFYSEGDGECPLSWEKSPNESFTRKKIEATKPPSGYHLRQESRL